MGTDAFGQVVKVGAQVEVVDFDDAEVAFDVGKVFVGGDDSGGVQGLGVAAGADDVYSVESGFGVDLLLVAVVVERVVGGVKGEVLGHLVFVDDLADGQANIIGSVQFPIFYVQVEIHRSRPPPPPRPPPNTGSRHDRPPTPTGGRVTTPDELPVPTT